MDPRDNIPIRAGRLPALIANKPKFGDTYPDRAIDLHYWAAFDQVYPSHVKLTVNPDHVAEFCDVSGALMGDGTWHVVPVHVAGWGELLVGGMVDRQHRAGRIILATTLDYSLARDMVGIQLSSPIDWRWMAPPQQAEMLTRRAIVMLKGLVATWAHHLVHDLGPGGSVLSEYARQWRYENDVAVYHDETWLDLRDPTTWRG